MTRLRIVAAVGALTVVIGTPFLMAAGLFQGLPIVSGAAYCAGASIAGVPGTTAQCNTTAPAGPAALTGSELAPADTQLSGGQPPQTVLIPTTLMAGGAVTFTSASGGMTLLNPMNTLIIDTGVIATLSLTLPNAPLNGQVFRLSTSHSVTAMTVVGAGGVTVLNAPAAITISTLATSPTTWPDWVYYGPTSTWYRYQ